MNFIDKFQLVWHQLVSPSVLLVRRDDVLAHWNSSTDMTPLINMDHRWRRLNVLGNLKHPSYLSCVRKYYSSSYIIKK